MIWINLNDKLPQYYKPVLIYCKNKRLTDLMAVAWLHTDGEKLNFTIYGTDNVIDIDKVSYWMPLPKPPIND